MKYSREVVTDKTLVDISGQEDSDVRRQQQLARDIARLRWRGQVGRVGEEAGPMDVGDHALIRGLGTASPLMRPGVAAAAKLTHPPVET